MPIYEFHCLACGVEFEKLVFGAGAVACPDCASRDVSRRPSVFGLKIGSGFAASGRGGCGCASGGCGCR